MNNQRHMIRDHRPWWPHRVGRIRRNSNYSLVNPRMTQSSLCNPLSNPAHNHPVRRLSRRYKLARNLHNYSDQSSDWHILLRIKPLHPRKAVRKFRQRSARYTRRYGCNCRSDKDHCRYWHNCRHSRSGCPGNLLSKSRRCIPDWRRIHLCTSRNVAGRY